MRELNPEQKNSPERIGIEIGRGLKVQKESAAARQKVQGRQKCAKGKKQKCHVQKGGKEVCRQSSKKARKREIFLFLKNKNKIKCQRTCKKQKFCPKATEKGGNEMQEESKECL